MKAQRPKNPSILPSRTYAPAAKQAPLVGGNYQDALQRRNALYSAMQRVRSETIFDPGTNPVVAQSVRDRYGFDDTTWRKISENVGAGIGLVAGFKTASTKAAAFSAATLPAVLAEPTLFGEVAYGLAIVGIYLSNMMSGMFLGKTLGGIATPSGVIASAELIQDVVVGMAQDPIKTTATVGAQVAATAIASKIGADKFGLKGTPLRIVSLYAGSLAGNGTATLANLIDPADEQQKQFTNPLSVMGKSLDQLEGGSLVRATLFSAVSGTNVFDNIAKAYGFSQSGYTEFRFGDIRQEIGMDIGLLGNQFVDFVGETLTDVGFWHNAKTGKTARDLASNVEVKLSLDNGEISNVLKGVDIRVKKNAMRQIANQIVEFAQTNNMTRLQNNIFAILHTANPDFKNTTQAFKTSIVRSILNTAKSAISDDDLKLINNLRDNKLRAKTLQDEILKNPNIKDKLTYVDELINNDFKKLNVNVLSKDYQVLRNKYAFAKNTTDYYDAWASALGYLNPTMKIIHNTPKGVGWLREKLIAKETVGQGGIPYLKVDEVSKMVKVNPEKRDSIIRKHLDALAQNVEQQKIKTEEINELKRSAEVSKNLKRSKVYKAYEKAYNDLQKEYNDLLESYETKIEELNNLNTTLYLDKPIQGVQAVDKTSVVQLETKLNELKKDYSTNLDEIVEIETAIQNYYDMELRDLISADISINMIQLSVQANVLKIQKAHARNRVIFDLETGESNVKEAKLVIPKKRALIQQIANNMNIDAASASAVLDAIDINNTNEIKVTINGEQVTLDKNLVTSIQKAKVNKRHEGDEVVSFDFNRATNFQKEQYIEQELLKNPMYNLAVTETRATYLEVLNNYNAIADTLPPEVKAYIENRLAMFKKYSLDPLEKLPEIYNKQPALFIGEESTKTIMDNLDNNIRKIDKKDLDQDSKAIRADLETVKNERNETIEKVMRVQDLLETMMDTNELKSEQLITMFVQLEDYLTQFRDGTVKTSASEQVFFDEEGNPTAAVEDNLNLVNLDTEDMIKTIKRLKASKEIKDEAIQLINELKDVIVSEGMDSLETIEATIQQLETEVDNKQLSPDERFITDSSNIKPPISEGGKAIFSNTILNDQVTELFGIDLDKTVKEGEPTKRSYFEQGIPYHQYIYNMYGAHAQSSKSTSSLGVAMGDWVRVENLKLQKETGLVKDPETGQWVPNTYTDAEQSTQDYIDNINAQQEDNDDYFASDDMIFDLLDTVKKATGFTDPEDVLNALHRIRNDKYDESHLVNGYSLGSLKDQIVTTIGMYEEAHKPFIIKKQTSTKATNIYSGFLTEEQTTLNGKSMSNLEFIWAHGTHEDRRVIVKLLMDQTGATKDILRTLNMSYEDYFAGKPINSDVFHLNNYLKKADIKNTNPRHLRTLINLKESILKNFTRVRMQNNAVDFEVLGNQDLLVFINELDGMLNGTELPVANSHLELLAGVDFNDTTFVNDLKPKVRNLNRRYGFIRNIKTNNPDFTDTQMSTMLDAFKQIEKVNLFMTNEDKSLVVDDAELNRVLNAALNVPRYKDKPEVHALINTILETRKAILAGDNTFENIDMSQQYNRRMADELKSLVLGELEAVKNTPQDHKSYGTARLFLNNKQNKFYENVSLLNTPLSRTAARSKYLSDNVLTMEYLNKQVFQTEMHEVDTKEFLKHNPLSMDMPKHIRQLIAKNPDTIKIDSEDTETLNYFKNAKESASWFIDDRLNINRLISDGAAYSVNIPRMDKEISRYKKLDNIYYSNTDAIEFSKNENRIRGVKHRSSMVMGILSDRLDDVFGLTKPPVYVDNPDDPYGVFILGTDGTLDSLSVHDMFISNLANLQDLKKSDYWYIIGKQHYDTNPSGDLNTDPTLISDIASPTDYTNNVDEDMVKAAIGLTNIMRQASAGDFITIKRAELSEQREKTKVTLEDYKSLRRELIGEYTTSMRGNLTLSTGEIVEKSKYIYSNILSKISLDLLDEYVDKTIGYTLTPEDKQFITGFRDGTIKEIDYKDAPKFVKHIMGIKQKQVNALELELVKIKKDYNDVIANETDPDKVIQLRIELSNRLKALEDTLDEHGDDLPKNFVIDDNTFEESEFRKKIREQEELLKAQRDADLQAIDDEYNQTIADINKKYSKIDTVKIEVAQDNIMEFLHGKNKKGLVAFLKNKYPNVIDIDKFADELFKKYDEKKNNITKKEIVYDTYTVADENGELHEVKLPRKFLQKGYSANAIMAALANPTIPDSIKQAYLADPDNNRELLNYVKEQSYNKLVILETDVTHLKEWENILSPEAAEYAELVAAHDPDYLRSVQNLKYELQEDIFNFLVGAENDIWNLGVEDPLPASPYAAKVYRSNQLSSYFADTFGNVMALYRRDDGTIDYQAILDTFVNNPNYTVVVISNDYAGNAKELTQGEVNPEDGSETPTVSEMQVTSIEDIQAIENLITEGYEVGFMTADQYHTARRLSYKPFKLPKALDFIYSKIIRNQKLAAVSNVGFPIRILSDIIMKNSLLPDGVMSADDALKLGLETGRLYLSWNKFQQNKMGMLQDIMALEEMLELGTAGAEEQYEALEQTFRNLNDQSVNDLLNKSKKREERLYIMYKYINKLSMGEYVNQFFMQNTDSSIWKTSILQKHGFDENLELNFPDVAQAIFAQEIAMLDEVHAFMRSSASSKEQESRKKIMERFAMTNPNRWVVPSEEHISWLHFQNPDKVGKKDWLDPATYAGGFLSINNVTTQVGYLHNYLMNKHFYGDNNDQAVARTLRTHFTYTDRSVQEAYASFVFPFLNAASENLTFWSGQLEKASTVRTLYNLTTAAWTGWYQKNDPEEENEYAKYLQYRGFVPLGNNTVMKLSLHSEALTGITLAQDMATGMTNRLNPVIREAVTGLQNPLSTVPYIGQAVDYFGNMSNRQGISKYLPSMFSHMYSKPEYRNQYNNYRNVYKQYYNAKGTLRVAGSNPMQVVQNIKYRTQERYYSR